MDELQAQVQVVHTLQQEYQSTLDSLAYLDDNFNYFLSNLSSEIVLRQKQRQHFDTKAGVNVRSAVLASHQTILNSMQAHADNNHKLFQWVTNQQRTMQQLSQYLYPSFEDAVKVSAFLQQRYIDCQKHIEDAKQLHMAVQQDRLSRVLGKEYPILVQHSLKEWNNMLQVSTHKDFQGNYPDTIEQLTRVQEEWQGTAVQIQAQQEGQQHQINRMRGILARTIDEATNLYSLYEVLGVYDQDKEQQLVTGHLQMPLNKLHQQQQREFQWQRLANGYPQIEGNQNILEAKQMSNNHPQNRTRCAVNQYIITNLTRPQQAQMNLHCPEQLNCHEQLQVVQRCNTKYFQELGRISEEKMENYLSLSSSLEMSDSLIG